MIIQVVCLTLASAIACVLSAIDALLGKSSVSKGWATPASAWQSMAVFLAANLAALAAGVDPAEDWSLIAPLWVAAALLHGLFSVAGLVPAGLAAFLAGLAMSGWLFGLSIQEALNAQ